jgi:hypothetical protein
MVVVIILFLQNCTKDNKTNDAIKNNSVSHIIRIEKNSCLYKEYKYVDSVLIYLKDSSSANYKYISYSYDSIKKDLIGFNILDGNGNKISRYTIDYNGNGMISALTIYRYNGIQESIDQKASITYETNKFTINTFLPETFEYIGKNICKHGFVSNNGIWTEYDFNYDSNPNMISKIGLPHIYVESISENNIVSVISKWTEYIDEMGMGDKIINHVDSLFTSKYTYNELGYPLLELRKCKTKVDTFKYIYE